MNLRKGCHVVISPGAYNMNQIGKHQKMAKSTNNRINRNSTAMESKSPPQTTVLRRLIDLDIAISHHIYAFFNPILPYALLKSLEFSGDGRLFFPIALSVLLATTPIAALTTTLTASSLLLVNLLIGAFIDLLLLGLLKYLFRRPRPVYNKNMSIVFAVDHWSFPSGHSSRVSCIAALFYFYSYQVREVLMNVLVVGDDWKKSLFVEHFVVIAAAWAAMTSVSRVLLGRHFVIDVVAGMCWGVFEALVVFQFLNYENLSSYVR